LRTTDTDFPYRLFRDISPAIWKEELLFQIECDKSHQKAKRGKKDMWPPFTKEWIIDIPSSVDDEDGSKK